ncbi:hypothetical protein J0S82_003119 [Galemys pyrenaicus]|uniref:Uncharacterized protein n=1 Tax=Galemys pyrenaicus TaxID=202257 RepID=A0A8J6ADW5_GALPY|nr:hypothetical protein J0S82_003119 [Galemys pyrenaicus]
MLAHKAALSENDPHGFSCVKFDDPDPAAVEVLLNYVCSALLKTDKKSQWQSISGHLGEWKKFRKADGRSSNLYCLADKYRSSIGHVSSPNATILSHKHEWKIIALEKTSKNTYFDLTVLDENIRNPILNDILMNGLNVVGELDNEMYDPNINNWTPILELRTKLL